MGRGAPDSILSPVRSVSQAAAGDAASASAPAPLPAVAQRPAPPEGCEAGRDRWTHWTLQGGGIEAENVPSHRTLGLLAHLLRFDGPGVGGFGRSNTTEPEDMGQEP